jgi:hypothetical protein
MPHAALPTDNQAAGVHTEVCKWFDIRAEHPLQLELRLDAFSQALDVRGGRVLGVSRWQKPEGGHLAKVQYSLPLLIASSSARLPE